MACIDIICFLLDVNDAPNELAYLDKEPQASISVTPASSVAISYPAISGYDYQIEATDNLQSTEPWGVIDRQSTTRYWQTLTATEAITSSDTECFYRVRAFVD